MPSSPTAVSAPGKVLLAGGYLCLDREYTALVYGLSARINVIAREIKTSPGVQLTEIVVDSPQFLEAQWRYGYHLAPEDGGIKVTQLQVGSSINPNPFVEVTLSYALTYIINTGHHQPNHTFDPARFTILADNDYYSQPHSEAAGTGTEKSTARFAKFPTRLKDAHKTGLGSSAALVTSLTAALLTYYLPASAFDLGTEQGRRTLHNLAQAAHCAAQGKVGSGFDVAAAVYGSCLYRRFSPSVLKALPEAGAPGFAPALTACVDDHDGTRWDTQIRAEGVRLPRGVALRMCDVDCGSQTVGMVKKVLQWREKAPADAKKLWDDLQARNEALGEVLARGQQQQQQDDDAKFGGEIAAAVAAVRALIRDMGARSGVPIEPDSQTALLDALRDGVEGVYEGVVPGAGGFDALALLMRDDEATVARVKEFLARWSREKGGVVRLLDVKGEEEGVRREGLAEYAGWVS
ncbi:ribosomal protein S5 domain 2-type protein [Biscogniauxia mediterranea]|nr:ribosomal protein S5 domain 2-type protein [Biscogniauxia mediterranea]